MRPTRVRVLMALAVLAAAAGWGLLQVSTGQSGRVLPVPWLAAATIWLLSIGVAIWAALCRPRLQRKAGTRPMPPLVAARTAALAMAASRTGALVAGFYAGVALGSFPARMTPAGSDAMWAALATAVGALGLVCAALWLEWLCRLPAEGPDGGTPGVDPHPRSQPGGLGARIGSSP
jgi:hypothetical protein